jgi:hypothetical protein
MPGPACYRTAAWEVLVERGVSMGTPIEADPLMLSAGLSHRSITERILALADRPGAKAAVIDAVDGTVTAWPRFGWTIRAAAHGLSRRGLAAGDTAAVFVQDAASFAIAVNAIRAAGATALAIRPDAGLAEVAARLNAGGVRLLITSAPLAGLAAEAADRSWVRQVFTFGEAAGTTSFRSLLAVAKHAADTHTDAGTHGADAGGRPEDAAGRPEDAAGRLTSLDGPAGLCHRDVVVAGPPCGDGYAYTRLLDLTLLTGATIVAAPVPLVTAAMRVYQGTAAIVPGGTAVSGLPPDRVFTVALWFSGGGHDWLQARRLSAGLVEQAGAVGQSHRFGSAAHAQLAVHVRAVVHDRLRAQVQSGGDLRVGLAAGDRGQHLELTSGQLGI